MKIRLTTFLIICLFAININIDAQTTYQYDENGNRTARLIDLGKDLEEKVSAH